jgi:polysaccharide chain length determinant protein (PEP-CTERM system associated)
MNLQEILERLLQDVRSGWRFRWYGLAAAWLLFMGGWGIVALLPNVFEAQARVFVDSTSALRPVLNNQIVPSDVATQLSYVRQSLLGRPQLEKVAARNGLDVGAVTAIDLDEVLADLRDTIRITARDNMNTVYTISYRNPDRDKAIGVVDTLLNTLVEDTIDANEEGSDAASRFLEERIGAYEQRLQEAEEKLAEFKRRNSDRLPNTQGGYFERLRVAREAVTSGERDLRLAVSRRDEINLQLNSESPVMPAGAETVIAQPEPNSLDARIRDYRSQIDALLLQYTPKHPDVIAAQEALARLQTQRSEQLRALGVLNPEQELSALSTNPVYQSLRIALNQANQEIAAIQARLVEDRADAARVQSLIDEVPEVEAELARLNRDYNVIYDQYQSLVRSRETQDLSQKAQSADQVDFRVIDPPFADLAPVAPHRVILLGAAFVMSLGLGAGVCWLLAQLTPVFGSAKALREACGLPVLGCISYAGSRTGDVFARLRFGAATACLVVTALVGVLVEAVGPGIRSLIGLA